MNRQVSSPTGGVRLLARLISGSGLAGLITGVIAWLAVRSQITAERIVVPGSADHLAGHQVKGPLSAYEQAETIKRIALEATGGRTYGELEDGDPAAETALHASLLRASLFTSVLAFGIAAAQIALGGVLIAIGTALDRLVGRTPAVRT